MCLNQHSRGGGIRTHDLFVPNEARYLLAVPVEVL
ncbi:hypothetical protein C7458_105166 [Williamsia muralis]|nr:hypothetical protein C7458_105166 [Williamsia marianensis]